MPPSSTSGSAANSTKGSPNVKMAKSDAEASAEDVQGAPDALNLSEADELEAANSKDDSDGGKIKALLGILRRMMGVKDLAAIRLSLPANLLEPVPNLEYWHYLDRGDIFAVVGDFEDPLDRMLATIRFAFTKELKFVHGKICKPYNSILGEHFRCHWDVKLPQVMEDGSLLPRDSLLTEKPKMMPNAKGKLAMAPAQSKSGATTPAASAADSERSEAQHASAKDDASSSAAHSPDLSKTGEDAGASAQSRPKHNTRGISTLSNLTIGSNDGADQSKARRGLSRLINAGRSKSSSNNSVKSFESSTPSSTTATSAATTQDSAAAPQKASDKAEAADDDEDRDDASDAGSFKTTKSSSNAAAGIADDERRIAFITEQVSHHPPISSFFVECKEAGVQLYGVDQLSAKFTGTNIKIFPGSMNQGIFLRLTEKARCGAKGEEYQITHPTASINGLLRGSLWVSIAGTTYITCRGGERGSNDNGKRLRTIIEYKDESWVGKAKYALEGCIYEYDASKDGAATEYTTVKEVPSDRVVATFEGTWKGQLTWKHKGEKESHLLIDLNDLNPIAKKPVRPVTEQEDMESHKIWKPVTDAIVGKQFNDATKHKQVIEQAQRDKAAERKKKGEEFTPRFFDSNIDDGRPTLTEAGRKAVDNELSR